MLVRFSRVSYINKKASFDISVAYLLAYLLQPSPTPEKEFAEYTFTREIYLGKHPTHTSNKIEEIAKYMNALMNTSGGLILLYSNIPDSDNTRDKWIMGFESHMIEKNWIPESLLQELVRYQYLEKDGQMRIYIFVSKSGDFVTFDFHAYGRLATGIRPLKDFQRVQKIIREQHIGSSSGKECASKIDTLLTEGQVFKIGHCIPVEYRESETMEFKHCYHETPIKSSEKSELRRFTAKELKKRLGDHLKCLSAFANTQGGSLILGVEEGGKFPVVRGFPVTQDQEAEETQLTEYLNERFQKFIWHGNSDYKPVKDKDWKVFYHKVIEDDRTERKMIEVRIPKHSGGMFLQCPEYYVVDRNGKREDQRDFSYWKVRFQNIATTSDPDKTDKQHDLWKHTESEDKQIDDQADWDDRASTVPKDLPEPVAAAAAIATLPTSFKNSESEHKMDIVVQGLSMLDCCTNNMSIYIKKLQSKGDQVWFPSIDHIRQQLPDDARCDKLKKFLQQKGQSWLASSIENSSIEIGNEADTVRTSEFPGWRCYILLLSDDEPPLLMCCIGRGYHCDINKQSLESLVDDALDYGRRLKRTFLISTANRQHQSCLFHFDIEVLLVPAEGDVKMVWDWRKEQSVIYPNASHEQQNTIACNGLAEILLSTRSSVKDRYGQILIEHLTDAQAKVLRAKRKRVLIVTGRSGTGKTVIALHLAKEATQPGSNGQDVVYICGSEGLKSFVSYQLGESHVSCSVILVNSTNSLSPPQKAMLQKAKLILVDDVHAIEVHKEWESNQGDLYFTLFTHAAKANTRVAIFFDPDQDYKEHLPKDFEIRLRGLAEGVPGLLRQDVAIQDLTERIRNSQEINRFMQANQNQARFMQANQNQAKIPGIIKCFNESPGDDVIYQCVGNTLEQSARIMNDKLNDLEKKYGAKGVAIICDDHDQMNEMKTILTGPKFNRCFQNENKYPIHHTVMCSLENFSGLEAEAILFLLPRNFGAGSVKDSWKYVNVISSRARERLEFLLPQKPAKEEQLPAGLSKLLELFKNVSFLCK